MKKNILILVIACLQTISLFSQEQLNWVTVDKAQELTRKTGKPLLIFIYTDWCEHCEKMQKTTLQNKELISYYNQHFILAKFNAESAGEIIFNDTLYKNPAPGNPESKHQLAIKLARMQSTLGFPTIVVFDKDLNKILGPTRGFKPVDRMELIGKYIIEGHYLTTPVREYIDDFEPSFGKNSCEDPM